MSRRGQGRARLDPARSGCFIPAAVPPSQADVPPFWDGFWSNGFGRCLRAACAGADLSALPGSSRRFEDPVESRDFFNPACVKGPPEKRILLTADPRSVVAGSGWWESRSTLLQTWASQMTKRSLIFKLFSSIIHAAGIMGHKKEEFHWVGLLDTEQSRGWKWDPALLKLKFFGDGEHLCSPSRIRLAGQGCSCICWQFPSPRVGSRPCSGSRWENPLQNLEASGNPRGCIPHQPEPRFGGSRDRVGVPPALPVDLLHSRWKHKWVIFR